MPPLQKVLYALNGSYSETHPSGREMRSRLGLARKAIEAMDSIDVTTLDQKAQLDYLMTRFELNVDLGYIDALENDLKQENVRKALPPQILSQYEMMSAGVLGDYERMDKSLKELEAVMDGAVQFWTKEVDIRRAVTVVAIKTVPGMQSGGPWPVAVALQTIPTLRHVEEAEGQRNKVRSDRLNLMTLRGCLYVEAGETTRARVLFDAIFAEAGKEHFFSEHIMARRYLQLLKGQGR